MPRAQQRSASVPPYSTDDALADSNALAGEGNRAKRRSLHIDWADGGARSGADVTEQQTRAMVAAAEDVLTMPARWRPGNSAVDEEPLPPSDLAVLTQAVDALQTGGDPTTVLMQG
jgi:hypothetical protein